VSGYDDDAREMGNTLGFDGGGTRDAASGAAVAQFIDDLRSLGEAEPPAPNAELAAVLQGAPVPRRRQFAPGRKRVVVAVAASLLVGGTGVAAANGRLPQPAQRLVSDVVDNLTPFSVPARSDSDGPSGPRTTPPDEREVVPPVVPGHREHPQPGASESEPGDSGPGDSESSGSESGGSESGGSESGGSESDGSESGGSAAGGSESDGTGSSAPQPANELSDVASSDAAQGDSGSGGSGSRDAGSRDTGSRDTGGRDTGSRDSGGSD
jgi:hypothetical protein